MITPERRTEVLPALIGRQVGEPARRFVCDECARFQGYPPKNMPDSGNKSWPCSACGHYGMGSYYRCVTGDWLRIWIAEDLLESCEAEK